MDIIPFYTTAQKLKLMVETLDTNYFIHTIIDNYNINECKISIVMTSSNRSRQVYYTLRTIANSNIKNIHIILVDDSDIDKCNIEILKTFDFYIDFIEIKRDKKFWVNPCINYNIGFKYIKCDKIILQNSEVCHVGDICKYINDELNSDIYMVFDVAVSNSFEQNEDIYSSDSLDYNIINKLGISSWYQCIHFNRNFHFLVSFTRTVFDKFKNFSYDYYSQGAYDDDDLVLKIKSLSIEIKNIFTITNQIYGIHLYHIPSEKIWDNNNTYNKYVYLLKNNYYNTHNKYIEYTDNIESLKLLV